MTARDSNSSRWTDEDIEKLLVDFYRRETPRELPPLRRPAPADSPQTVTVVASGSMANARRGGYAGLAVAACLLLLFVAVLSPTRNDSPTAPTHDIDVVSDHKSRTEAVVAKKPVEDLGPVIIAVPDVFGPLRLPDTAPLPPELIPPWELPEAKASAGNPPVEPPRNDWLDRLDIQVFPLPEERKTPMPAPRRLPEQE